MSRRALILAFASVAAAGVFLFLICSSEPPAPAREPNPRKPVTALEAPSLGAPPELEPAAERPPPVVRPRPMQPRADSTAEPTRPARPASSEEKPEKLLAVPSGPALPPAADPEVTVRNTLHLAQSAFEACYEHSLRRDNRVKGKLVVSVDVLASGQVSSAKITETSVRDNAVLDCIASRLRQLRFPPLGEEVEVSVPMALVPRAL